MMKFKYDDSEYYVRNSIVGGNIRDIKAYGNKLNGLARNDRDYNSLSSDALEVYSDMYKSFYK